MAKREPTRQELLLSDAYRILSTLDSDRILTGDANRGVDDLGLWDDIKDWIRSYLATLGQVPLTPEQEEMMRTHLAIKAK